MLADDIAWALPDLRAEAESRMTSTCSIAPPGSEPVTDDVTGEVTFPSGDAVYEGPCRFRPASAQGSTANAGGAEVFTFDYMVSVPFEAAGVSEGHRVVCLTSPDQALVGVIVEVEKVDRGDELTARRLYCSEVA